MTPLPQLDHLSVLCDDVGVIQHALDSVPNRATGYCTDDVARAFIVACKRIGLASRDDRAHRIASTALAFLHDAQLQDGRFHNFMAYDRRWTDDVGSDDCNGRAMWALGYGIAEAPSEGARRACRTLFDRALGAIESLHYLRAQAYAILGLTRALQADKRREWTNALTYLADKLIDAWHLHASTDWPWFEAIMTYDNARLPEALIRTGIALAEPRYADAGCASLQFYEEVTLEDGIFVPIGNEGWYPRGGSRARYAQQPLEAAAMVDAELAAFGANGHTGALANAAVALAWYQGKNSRSVVMSQGGGCYDGLHEDRVNTNMGAESTLAMLSAAYGMALHRSKSLRAVQ
jgi:hypothetical protein